MTHEVRASIGARLRKARRAAGMTQQDVANDFHHSRQAISSWETGHTLPSLEEFRELVALYGVTADAVLYGVTDTAKLSAAVIERARTAPPDFADSAM